jgi:hypothetical protein
MENFPRFYFYAGKKESNTMVSDMEKMANIIEKKSDRFDVRRIVYPLGEHNEKTWRQEFPDFYKWLMR